MAISRARQGVVIFSTLRPEQIDLSRVRASGVRDLKHYLEFAIRGPRALVEQSVPTGREPDSPFEAQVIALLREHGWSAHPQVGVSGYRLDIGVVDPRAPGRYLLGVECDGASYHSGATARDRDRLRQHVLEGLGWELHRIWSTDWWLDREAPARRLLARLEQLVAQPLEPEPSVALEPALQDEPPSAPEPIVVEQAASALPAYRIAPLEQGEAEGFHERAALAVLRAQLVNTIQAEGPILQQLLLRRVARAWGQRLSRRVEELLVRLCPYPAVEGVYWPRDVDPATWDGLRIPSSDPDSRRAIDEISLHELGNAAVYVLQQQGSTSVDSLARAVCRLFGISRTTADAEARIVAALSQGRAAGAITLGDGVARAAIDA